jgi:hypothetical protein
MNDGEPQKIKRGRGRPIGSKTGNPNGTIGRPKLNLTPEQIEQRKEKNRAQQRAIYKKKQALIIEAKLRKKQHDNKVEEIIDILREQLSNFEYDDLDHCLTEIKSATVLESVSQNGITEG